MQEESEQIRKSSKLSERQLHVVIRSMLGYCPIGAYIKFKWTQNTDFYLVSVTIVHEQDYDNTQHPTGSCLTEESPLSFSFSSSQYC